MHLNFQFPILILQTIRNVTDISLFVLCHVFLFRTDCYSIAASNFESHKSFQSLATPVLFSVTNVSLVMLCFQTNKLDDDDDAAADADGYWIVIIRHR